MKRTQIEIIEKDLKKKIVFLVGPRQVGKTWLSKEIAKKYKNSLYLNYDNAKDRDIIKNESWLNSTDLIIFDELHKMKNWKTYIKGVFDTNDDLNILVTGSARLDAFRQSGDSMAGRYFIHHLLPFSLSEIHNTFLKDEINRLIERGGFPEPFLAENDIDAKRWRKFYINGLIREDILDFENITNLKSINLLFELLRERVASNISYSSLARDLNISATTVKKYINILEALYIIFKVTPYSKNIARSILKEPKIYFFDTGLVRGDNGVKFENFVALSLLKFVYHKRDVEGEEFNLNYIRTKDGKEIDFSISNDNTLLEFIEVKYKKNSIPKNLLYFSKKYDIKGTVLVKELKREYQSNNIEVRDAINYLNCK